MACAELLHTLYRCCPATILHVAVSCKTAICYDLLAQVLVGEMATWHQEADAFLQSDIGALAGTVGSLTRCTSMSSVYCDVAEAHRSIASSSGHRGFNSRVHTVIMPHDVARAPVDATPSRGERPEPTLPEVQVPRLFEAKTLEFLESCAAAMLARRPGKVCLMLGGDALLSEPGLLELAGRIAAATGAVLMSEAMVSRADRGEGLPRVRRLPYFPKVNGPAS